ncbi:RING-H2 finger protein ATL16-like [Phalaenopsis equestris]|uniref:RING-H2 finger protein ATL16-like n=1 Tax=Phalaenopsis equestris TaxID=78828 RepID=UPI0009E5AD10|nr:RING-H2 finger protein ATL16-like [Phalaenopsis equestris]
MSLSIAVVAIAGILWTATFFFSYSVFVFKCCLKWRSPNFLIRTSPGSNTAEPTGLDSAAIRSIPTFCYSSNRSYAATECAVCLSDFRPGEHLRLLPQCSHAFHIDCIDAWLQTKTSCPLCRSRITNPFPPRTVEDHRIIPNQSVIIEVSEEEIRNQRRRLGQVASMGDECIEVRREKDEVFAVLPLRRSFSLDSSCDPQLCVSVQETLRRNLDMIRGQGSSDGGAGGGGGGGSGRIRQSFFPFGGRSWRSAVLPVNIDAL